MIPTMRHIMMMLTESAASSTEYVQDINALLERSPSRTEFDRILNDPSIKVGFECEMLVQQDHATFAKIVGQAIGAKVEVRSAYHDLLKDPEQWYIEPDRSIKKGKNGGFPAELVSPAFSLADGLRTLQIIFDTMSRNGAYTNSSTGLHINLSIDGKAKDDFDFLKMIVFYDENHVGDLFKRLGNDYTRMMRTSLASKASSVYVSAKPDSNDESTFKGITALKNTRNITNAAMLLKRIGSHLGSFFSNNYSIMRKRDIFEFRNMGGLGYEKRFADVRKQAIHMANAMRIGSDDNLYAQEYITKVTLLLNDGKYGREKPGAGKKPAPWLIPDDLKYVIDDTFTPNFKTPLEFVYTLARCMEDDGISLDPNQAKALKYLMLKAKITPEQLTAELKKPEWYNHIANAVGWPLAT